MQPGEQKRLLPQTIKNLSTPKLLAVNDKLITNWCILSYFCWFYESSKPAESHWFYLIVFGSCWAIDDISGVALTQKVTVVMICAFILYVFAFYYSCPHDTNKQNNNHLLLFIETAKSYYNTQHWQLQTLSLYTCKIFTQAFVNLELNNIFSIQVNSIKGDWSCCF